MWKQACFADLNDTCTCAHVSVMNNGGHAHHDEHCSMKLSVSPDCYPLMRHMSGENALPLTLLVKQDSQRIATSMTRHSCILDCLTSSSAGMSTSVRFLLTDPKMTTPPLKRYTLRGVVLVTITQSLKKGEKTALLYKELTANCSRSIYSEPKHLYNLAVYLLPACIYESTISLVLWQTFSAVQRTTVWSESNSV